MDDQLERDEIARRNRWSAKGRAYVVHPDYGRLRVPCASPFAAVLCAAEIWHVIWHVDWAEILDSNVEAIFE